MTLLEIVRAACARLSLPRPSSVILSADLTVIQLLELAQQHGRELSRFTGWRTLTSEKTFTTIAAAEQTDAIPDDFDWLLPETMFNRSLNREVTGPLSPTEWQAYQSSLVTRIDPAFRIRGSALLFSPTPSAGETIAYEYITKNWCKSEAGALQPSWAADSDTPRLNDELHVSGLVWRFRQAKGLDFTDDLQIHEGQVRQAMMREGGRPRISTDGPEHIRRKGDATAGPQANVILTDGGDQILWN